MTFRVGKLQLYLQHRQALVDFATPITGCRDRAEDVVQDAWLRFADAAAATDQPRAYLYRIVRNLALDGLRRQQMESRHQTPDGTPWLEPSPLPEPEQTLDLQQRMAYLVGVLDTLPPDVRRALELYRFNGLTLEQVAAELDVSVATAHRHVRRALVALAQHLSSTE